MLKIISLAISLADGGQLHVETAGDGEPLVLVHADFVDGRMWDSLRVLLAAKYQVVIYDKRGYGRSSPAVGPICRRQELETVLSHLNLGPVHLVGCSNGGQQALDLALTAPQLVRSLTLINASPSGFVPEGEPPAELLSMFEAFQKDDLAAASEWQVRIWFDGPQRIGAHQDPKRTAARQLAGEMNRVFVDRRTFFVADADPLYPLDPPAVQRLSAVRVPTLVLSGMLDYEENQRASRLLASGIPGARLVEIPDTAHVPSMELPEVVASLIDGFAGILGSSRSFP